VTALEAAQAELSESMVPYPDDFLTEYSPQAALLFVRQCSMVALQMVTGAAASLETSPDEDQPVVAEVMNGVAACIAGSTHALVALGVLPVEAEEALTNVS
jgi:hypothetical protein